MFSDWYHKCCLLCLNPWKLPTGVSCVTDANLHLLYCHRVYLYSPVYCHILVRRDVDLMQVYPWRPKLLCCCFKQHKFMILPFWKSEFQNASYRDKNPVLGSAECLLESLVLFLTSRGFPHSLAHGPLASSKPAVSWFKTLLPSS